MVGYAFNRHRLRLGEINEIPRERPRCCSACRKIEDFFMEQRVVTLVIADIKVVWICLTMTPGTLAPYAKMPEERRRADARC
jgi:hypothetical protein